MNINNKSSILEDQYQNRYEHYLQNLKLNRVFKGERKYVGKCGVSLMRNVGCDERTIIFTQIRILDDFELESLANANKHGSKIVKN